MLTIAGGILIAGFIFWMFCMAVLVGLNAMLSRSTPTPTTEEKTGNPKKVAIVSSAIAVAILAVLFIAA